MREDAPLLEVVDLKAHLHTPRGTVRAVDGVSFSVAAGQKVALVGESGCGKSMTARAILGLLPPYTRRTVSGAVRYRGKDLLTMDEQSLTRVRGARIAMVFQDPLTYLNPRMSVGQQISEAIWLHAPRSDIAGRRAEVLAQVGLRSDAGLLGSYPHELSGGMRQRVMIAMALAPGPEVLIADEPTTALDVTLQAQILALLGRLCDDLGLALVLITHDMGVVAETCEQVHVMYAGQIVESGETADLFAARRHPYTDALLGAALSVERVQDEFVTIGGAVPDLITPPPGCRFQPRCPRAFEPCDRPPPMVKLAGPASARCWLHAQSEVSA
jgi:oligopeptide/dipeptide ABC transporter ATP-binding protein